MPMIQKASRVHGKSLILRNASVEDSSFIYKLRQDVTKSEFLSPIGKKIIDQQKWLELYSGSLDHAYFIIEDTKHNPFGTVRLYDAKGDSFCWGSWLLISGSPKHFATESALVVYKYALHLGFTSSHFDVRKGNTSVWRFHERFGATRIKEDLDNFYYRLGHEQILESLSRLKRFLPDDIVIDVM